MLRLNYAMCPIMPLRKSYLGCSIREFVASVNIFIRIFHNAVTVLLECIDLLPLLPSFHCAPYKICRIQLFLQPMYKSVPILLTLCSMLRLPFTSQIMLV